MPDFVGVVATLGSAILAVVTAADMTRTFRRLKKAADRIDEPVDPAVVRRQRIARLQTSLRESATLLAELEADIDAGQERVDELQEQINRSAELAKLTDAQADAVRGLLADVVGDGLGRSERRAFMQQLGLNVLFFGLGIGVALIVG